MRIYEVVDLNKYCSGVFEWWTASTPNSPFIEFLTSAQHIYCGVPTWSVEAYA